MSDGETIYLTGYHAMYALQPLTAEDKQKRRDAPPRSRAARRRNDRKVLRAARPRGAPRPASARSAAPYRRCVERRPAQRRKAARAECLQRAKQLHRGRKGRISRSYRSVSGGAASAAD